MGSSRQEYWNGLPCPPPGDLPNSGVEPMSLMSPALAGRLFTIIATWEALIGISIPKMKFTRPESNIEKKFKYLFFSTITPPPFLPKNNHSKIHLFCIKLDLIPYTNATRTVIDYISSFLKLLC